MARNSESKAAQKGLSALEKRFEGFGKARDVLTTIKVVPTRFVQYDHAIRIGGWPLQRSTVVHGPSSEGKTIFLLGIAGSFIERGHFAHLVDAERTTTIAWCSELLGELAKSDRFYATRPESYEKCVDETRRFHRSVRDARLAGEVPPETSAITIVDSLRKLVPEDIMSRIVKDGASGAKGSVDGMGGRAAQIRAAMNAAWMDDLIPLLDECGTAFSAIARESEDPNADMWARKFGNDYRVQGGKSIIYDASIVNRIERAGYTMIEKGGDKVVVGERHRITVRKTKVGGKEGRASVAFFHTSNGVISPPGFDRARDVVELGLRLGVVQASGAWASWKGERWGSREKMIAALNEATGDLAVLEEECRARFQDVEPEAPAEGEDP